MIKFKEDDVGKGVSLELKTSDGRKEKIFGRVVAVKDKEIEVEVIPKPYTGDRPVKIFSYEDIKNYRLLPS